MASIQPKGEKVRQAIRWISQERKMDEGAAVGRLIAKASERFNLSPKEEDFLRSFYETEGG